MGSTFDSRNPPQLLRHRQRHHRRGFGAQHARAEAGGVVAGGLGLFDFGVRQTAFRTNQEHQRRRFVMADQGSATGCSTSLSSASVCFSQSASSKGGWMIGTLERPHCSQALIAT